jgi:hypothetical protein
MIPDSTLLLARDMLALQARAIAEHELLTAAANQASGAEAVGKAALAAELEQVGKVLSNYMPRIMKHVGEIDLLTEPSIPEFLKETRPPDDIVDIINWSAPPKERQAALLVKLNEVNGLIGLAEDRGGRAAPELYTKRDRIESGLHYNRATLAEAI